MIVGTIPLSMTRRLDRLIRFAFGPVFGRALVGTFHRTLAGAAAVPWYLSGGIAAAGCDAAYLAKAAASEAASYVNLNNPGTYDLTATIAPGWDATGWAFTGTEYLKTGWIPPSVDITVIVRFSDATGTLNCAIGSSDGTVTQLFLIRPRISADHRYLNGGSTELSVSGLLASGVMCIAGTDGYLDGSDEGNITTGVQTPAPLYIGGFNVNNAAMAQGFVGKIQAVALYSVVITSAQVAAVSTAMAAL